MEDIKQKFIEEFKIPKGNKKEPYIILFDAYIGMGKSTVSKVISKYDNSVILNNDQLKYWMNDYDNKKLKDELQHYRLEELLKNNNSCIHDFCFIQNWEEKKKYYDSLGYKIYIIRLECSEDTIKERLSKRTIDGINFSRAGYDDYLIMKSKFKRVDDNLIDYVINTEKDLDVEVLGFLNKYNLI